MSGPTVEQLERDAALVRAMAQVLGIADAVAPALKAAATADSRVEREEADALLRRARVRCVFRAEIRYLALCELAAEAAEAKARMHEATAPPGMSGEARRMAKDARRAAEAARACHRVHSMSAWIATLA